MYEQLRNTPDPSVVADTANRPRVRFNVKARVSWYSCRTKAEDKLVATLLPGQITFCNERHGILLHKDELHTASHGAR